MIKIPLVNTEYFVLVDDEFSYLQNYHWYRLPGKNTDYARGKVNGKWISMHRIVANTPDGLFVDHVDGNGLNNQKSNLRNVTMKENNIYRVKNKTSTNPYKGVTFHPKTNKWRVRICGHGRDKPISLGLFSSPEEAARVYDNAAIQYFGEFAKLNFPFGGTS